MKITELQLRRIMPNAPADKLAAFVKYFNEWSDQFGITTPIRAAMFVSQAAHECVELKSLTENLNYSADGLLRTFPKYFSKKNVASYARNPQKIANRVYANRMGNGSEGSGDGYRYRGRGCFQLTGRSNYQAYNNSPQCNGDLMGHPEWLAQFPGAIKSAMWFWSKKGLNKYADKCDFRGLTRAINGGYNGLEQREIYFSRAKTEFGMV